MKAHLIDTHLLVQRSRLSAKVKVKYQGHVSQKMGVSGALVFHKHILFDIISLFAAELEEPKIGIPIKGFKHMNYLAISVATPHLSSVTAACKVLMNFLLQRLQNQRETCAISPVSIHLYLWLFGLLKVPIAPN